MRYFLNVSYLIVLVCLTSCKKNPVQTKYSITGRLLESSSNPVPVKNYQLELSQASIFGFFGELPGIDQKGTTDNDGKFVISYMPGKGTGIEVTSKNTNPISLSGSDTGIYKNLYFTWYPISAYNDTDLHTIFLYKKIEKLVRKVQFNSSLNSGDSLEVITDDASGTRYKTLKGPISPGTLLIVDTILSYKISRIDLGTKNYISSSTLKKPMYQSDFSSTLPPGDETFREILLTY